MSDIKYFEGGVALVKTDSNGEPVEVEATGETFEDGDANEPVFRCNFYGTVPDLYALAYALADAREPPADPREIAAWQRRGRILPAED